MANWNLPTTADLYTDLINYLKSRDLDSATMFKTLPTNPVSDMVRWDSSANKFDVYSGSSWVSLSSLYQINVATFNGQNSAYYRNATNLNAGSLAGARFTDTSHGNRSGGSLHSAVVSNGASGFMIGTDKNKLNNIETAATADQSATEILNLLISVNSTDGSGINASTVNGLLSSSTPSNSTMVSRTSNGYIQANQFNTNATAITTNPTDVYVNTNDGYIRKQSKASFISNLGLSVTSHLHTGVYEPVITQNTAFNKSFGVALGNVAQGNHLHTGVYNPIIGTDTDIAYSGASVLASITMTDGVIQAHTARNLTPANIGAAALSSPAFTGTPTAPTPVQGTNNTQLATTAFVKKAPIADSTSETNNYHSFDVNEKYIYRNSASTGSLVKTLEVVSPVAGSYYTDMTGVILSTDSYGTSSTGTIYLYINGVYQTKALGVSYTGYTSTAFTITINKGDLVQIYTEINSYASLDYIRCGLSLSSSNGRIANFIIN